MGNLILNNLLTEMKFAVAIALISTASAAVTEGCASVVDLTAATQTDHCDCPALCKACVHATPGTAADAKVTAADTTCTSCKATTDTFTKNDADTMGKCTAAAGDAGKALEGKECDGDGEDKGCADGLQCGKTEEVKRAADATDCTAAPGSEVCVKTEACKEPVVCGAMQLGASLVAAVAIANLM